MTMPDGAADTCRGDAAELYSAIAPGYDRSYAVPGHRRIYDRLAWDAALALPRPADAHVIDVGCGTGRWSEALVSLGCRVTGIENAPGMIAEQRARALGRRFTLIDQPMEHAVVADNSADLVLAMGSVQFAPDPAAMLRKFAGWLRPGGHVCLYVDSLVALVVELLRGGETVEALDRLRARRGVFRHGGRATSLRLYDRSTLESDMTEAGFVDISCRGLAIEAAAIGRRGSTDRLVDVDEAMMEREHALSSHAVLADCGLHLLAIGRKPG